MAANTLFIVGWNNTSGLGDGTTSNSTSLIQIGAAAWSGIYAQNGLMLGIQADGSLWAWGANGYGQFGDGTATDSLVPVHVGSDTWLTLTEGLSDSVLGIKSDGTLWAWGNNGSGQFGDGTTTGSLSPVQIGSATWTQVAAGQSSTIAIKSDGTLWTWGGGASGELGNGTTATPVLSPAQIGSDTWLQVSCKSAHVLAIKSDGTLWAWGSNAYGQLGDGTTTDQNVPIQIGVASWSFIDAGADASAAVKADGTLWTWGFNFYGQLGDGTTTDSPTPTQLGASTWLSASVGSDHMQAIRADGAMYAWGSNWAGQFGDGTTTDSLTPVHVGGDTWTKVSTTQWLTMALLDTGSALPSGVVECPIEIRVAASGIAECPLRINIPFWHGTAACPLEIRVAASGSVACPLEINLAYPSGVAACPLEIRVAASGSVACPLEILVDDGVRDGWWSARLMLGGVDLSARLTGQIKVDAEEGAARIAEFSLKSETGPVDALEHLGATVTIDYLLNAHGATVQSWRLFTGRVDTPSVDLATGVLSYVCTDDLRNRVAAMTVAQVNALVGGYYSAAIQGGYITDAAAVGSYAGAIGTRPQSGNEAPEQQTQLKDRWDYALARMETVAGSLDCDAYGTPRVTHWQGAPLAATYAEADMVGDSWALDLPTRSGIVNVVRCSYEYRYTRLRQRWGGVGWSMAYPDNAASGFQYPDQSTIASAFAGVGWTVLWQLFMRAPTRIAYADGFVYPTEGSIALAQARLTQRHTQTLTERYTLLVRAPESISVNGSIAQETRGALASAYTGDAWETDLSLAPTLTEASPEMDYAPDASAADSSEAMRVLLEQARVKILASHRSGRARAACPCAPEIDLDSRVAIAASAFTATGKVASVVHTLDLAKGSAITEFSLALYAANGTGTVTPSPLSPSPATPEITLVDEGFIPLQTVVGGANVGDAGWMGWLVNPSQSITVRDTPDGTKSVANPAYTTNGLTTTGFRMHGPGVDSANRNPVVVESSTTYDVALPLDAVTLNL